MTVTRPGIKLFQLSCAALLLLVVGVLFWRILLESEPNYEGVGLRAWLNAYCTAEYEGDREVARQAIRRIGTNAIPRLLEMLTEKDSKFTTVLDSFSQRHRFKVRLATASQHRALAAGGFHALRSTGRPATPELIRLVGDQDVGVRVSAIRSLGYVMPIGPQAASGTKALQGCLTDSNFFVRHYAAEAMREIEHGPSPWFP